MPTNNTDKTGKTANKTSNGESKVIIYTDGACKGNPGVGGWGALLHYNGVEKPLFGGEIHTTNNRMELTAPIEALKVLTRRCKVDIWTDSNYVKKGISEWIINWRTNGWKNSSKKDVVNKDLWLLLDEQCQKHDISWHWVKGHAGNAGNEIADNLANKGVELALKRNKTT